MATTDKTWEQEAWDELPANAKELFEQVDEDAIMHGIMTSLIALAHKSGNEVTYLVGTLYMSLLAETKPDFLVGAIKAASRQFEVDPDGMAELLTKLDD